MFLPIAIGFSLTVNVAALLAVALWDGRRVTAWLTATALVLSAVLSSAVLTLLLTARPA